MSRPNGGWRCRYGTWHDLFEACTCPPSAVLALAFPQHPLVDDASAEAFAAEALVIRDYRAEVEKFELDVLRVMWEQNVERRTAVHVVTAGRRLESRKAEVRAARAA